MKTHELPGIVQKAVEELEKIGLYARGSCSIDWENYRRSGHRPIIIRGGTHVEDSGPPGYIRTVHGSFYIEASDDPPGYVVCWPEGQKRMERHFGYFVEALMHVAENWHPPSV